MLEKLHLKSFSKKSYRDSTQDVLDVRLSTELSLEKSRDIFHFFGLFQNAGRVLDNVFDSSLKRNSLLGNSGLFFGGESRDSY